MPSSRSPTRGRWRRQQSDGDAHLFLMTGISRPDFDSARRTSLSSRTEELASKGNANAPTSSSPASVLTKTLPSGRTKTVAPGRNQINTPSSDVEACIASTTRRARSSAKRSYSSSLRSVIDFSKTIQSGSRRAWDNFGTTPSTIGNGQQQSRAPKLLFSIAVHKCQQPDAQT